MIVCRKRPGGMETNGPSSSMAIWFWAWWRVIASGFPGEQFQRICAHADRMKLRPCVRAGFGPRGRACHTIEI